MSGWYYACIKTDAEFGDGYEYTLVEAFPDLAVDGEIPYTDKPLFYTESPKELAKWLRRAADDVEKYGVINDA